MGLSHHQVFGHQPPLQDYTTTTHASRTPTEHVSTTPPDDTPVAILGLMSALAPGIRVANNGRDEDKTTDLTIQPHAAVTPETFSAPNTISAPRENKTGNLTELYGLITALLKNEGNKTLNETFVSGNITAATEKPLYTGKYALHDDQREAANISTTSKPERKVTTEAADKPQYNDKHPQHDHDQKDAENISTTSNPSRSPKDNSRKSVLSQSSNLILST